MKWNETYVKDGRVVTNQEVGATRFVEAEPVLRYVAELEQKVATGATNVLPFVSKTETVSEISSISELEHKAIEEAIFKCRGNLTEASKQLKIGRATLYRKIKEYSINPSLSRNKKAA